MEYKNLFHGYIPLEINQLDGLTYLDASSNQIDSIIPPSIGELNNNLETLKLDNNNIVGSLPFRNRNLNNLNYLKLNNQLTGSIPQELAI